MGRAAFAHAGWMRSRVIFMEISNHFCRCGPLSLTRKLRNDWDELIERTATENYLKQRVLQLKRKIALKDAEITNLQYQLENQTKTETV